MESFENIFKMLSEISPAGLVMIVLIGVNLLLRRTPNVPNWLIPWISILIGTALTWLFLPKREDIQHAAAWNICIGFLAGLAAAIFYKGIVVFAEKKWPWLHDIINDPDEPKPPTP